MMVPKTKIDRPKNVSIGLIIQKIKVPRGTSSGYLVRDLGRRTHLTELESLELEDLKVGSLHKETDEL